MGVEFQKTLIQEPPIPFGTPDPYEPKKKLITPMLDNLQEMLVLIFTHNYD
jgi:hypothetical protein